MGDFKGLSKIQPEMQQIWKGQYLRISKNTSFDIKKGENLIKEKAKKKP